MQNAILFQNLQINRYKQLGSGYISTVYEATDKTNSKKYAVKIVN